MARSSPGIDRVVWTRVLAFILIALLVSGGFLAALAGDVSVAIVVMMVVLPSALGILFACYLALMLTVLIHEAGHILGGCVAGMRLQMAIVGPLELHRRQNRWKLSRGSSLRFGGFVRMLPQNVDRLSSRFALMVAFGPLASILFALAMYGVYRIVPAPTHADSLAAVIAYEGLVLLLWMSLSILPGTLFPFTARSGNSTDMRILLTLLRSKRGRDRYVALLLQARELLAGVRARDWTTAYCDLAAECEDGDPEEARARIMAFYHYWDRGDQAIARKHLERGVTVARMLGKKRGVQGALILFEAAYLAAVDGRDPSLAELLLAEAGDDQEACSSIRHAVLAAIAALRGDRDLMNAHLESAEEALRETHARYGGNLDFDLDRFAAIRDLTRGPVS